MKDDNIFLADFNCEPTSMSVSLARVVRFSELLVNLC